MSLLSHGVLWFFVAASFLAFIVPFFKEGVAKKLSLEFNMLDLKRFCFVLLPFILLFVVGQCYHLGISESLKYFVAAALLPFILTRFNLPSRLIGIVTLLVSVLLTSIFATGMERDGYIALSALVAGLLVWKLATNLFLESKSQSPHSNLEDVLPSLLWLGGLYWINASSPETLIGVRQALLLGAMSTGLLMRVLQGPFMTDDKIYLKKVVLSCTAGLLFLIFITKVAAVPQFAPLALLFGAAIFCGHLIQNLDNNSAIVSAADSVKILTIVGMLTLVAARLFGTFGWLVLAPIGLIATGCGALSLAGLFWIARVDLQGFVAQFNNNVTGINITHAYAGAALYAGLLLVLVLSVFLRDVKDRKSAIAVSLLTAVLAPIAANYFLHVEATSSLLVAVTVASVILAVFAPVLYQQERANQVNLILLPFLMIVSGTLSNQLIDLGNTATAQSRLNLLAYLAIAVLVAFVIILWKETRSRGKNVEVSGE